MPVLDSCQGQIAFALRKDGLTVKDKPKYVYDQETDSFIFIDLEAVREANGLDTSRQQFYLEVKCFPGHNERQELYIAFGQYVYYRSFLAKMGDRIPLFLAIPSTIYVKTFDLIVRQTCRQNGIKLLIVDVQTETIVEWIE